jgi:hypothetical protein
MLIDGADPFVAARPDARLIKLLLKARRSDRRDPLHDQASANAPTLLGPVWHSRDHCQRHRGTGIWRDRDIAAGWRAIETPCASLPTRSPSQPRTPARKAGVLHVRERLGARDRLTAGGRWIRTCSTAAREPIAIALRPPAADRNLARAGRSPGFKGELGASRRATRPRRPGRSPGWRAWRRGLDTGAPKPGSRAARDLMRRRKIWRRPSLPSRRR